MPDKGEKEFLAVARIVKPQGRRGEVAAEILTDFPERFARVQRTYLERPGQEPRPVELENAWPHKGRVVLKFAGVDSINQANSLRGLHVLVPRQEKMPLPAHHYYVWELRGCRVVAEQEGKSKEVGTVTDVEPTGGVDLLHVAPQGRPRDEVLIPLAQDICKRIDTEAKTIVIDPPEDLLELND
ncbi:MAG: 16S rRNA processing protein RimM [Acidobacteria bacterium]|nr:16S rRNA processing protein RimM [Acidobacteriota bacterium]